MRPRCWRLVRKSKARRAQRSRKCSVIIFPRAAKSNPARAGEGDEQAAEVEELRKKIEAAKMPEEAEKQALKELDRLAHLPTAAAEYGVIRTYLDWFNFHAMGYHDTDNLDIAHAREVLDRIIMG